MTRHARVCITLALLLAPVAALAIGFPTEGGGGSALGTVLMWLDGSGNAKAVSTSSPMPVTPTPNAGTGAYNPTGYTVGTTASAAGLATPTVFLDIVNDSASATIAFCFGTSCTPVINGAGSITLPPGWHRSWEGSLVPIDPMNWIATAASTPVTVGVK